MTVNLGMPTPPVPTLAPRRKTHQIKVGDVLVGGDAPISVQSMTCLLYTSPSPRDVEESRMPSSA